ncbi:MAG: ATP-binding protein [Campylobacter sp.]
MQTLNVLYQNPPKNVKFINRKFEITAPKTLIKGSIGSGKTSLMLNFLSYCEKEEFLYINFADFRIEKDEIWLNLLDFLSQNPKIKILAIDDFEPKFIENLKPILELNLSNFIISTRFKNLNLIGFDELNLHFLDYEEFIAFFQKKFDPQTLLSHFLLRGKSPSSCFCEAENIAINLQNTLKSSLSDLQLATLKECAKNQAQNVSIFEIYNELKLKRKISKDSVYAVLAELENIGIISLLQKFNEPNAAKKLYFNDFAFKMALSFKKDFNKIFNNTVFGELSKFKEQIFYTKELDFFLIERKLGIICNPFGDTDLLFLKFKKLHSNLKNLGVKKLQMISMANSGESAMQGIRCEIIPFGRWALGIDF